MSIYFRKRGLSPYQPRPNHNVQQLESYDMVTNFGLLGEANFRLNRNANLIILNVNLSSNTVSAPMYAVCNIVNGELETIAGGSGGMFGLDVSLNGNTITAGARFIDDGADIACFQYGGGSGEHVPFELLSTQTLYGNSENDITISDECNAFITLAGFHDAIGNHIGRPYLYYNNGAYFTESTNNLDEDNRYVGFLVSMLGSNSVHIEMPSVYRGVYIELK